MRKSTVRFAGFAVLCIAVAGASTLLFVHVLTNNVDATATSAGMSDVILPLSFATLGCYIYEPPDPERVFLHSLLADRIPQSIHALNGAKVTLQGFIIPIEFKNGKSAKFILAKDRVNCCFGEMARMNEWVFVTMKPGTSACVNKDELVTVSGTLEVGELIENCEIQSIYRIQNAQSANPL